MLLARRLTSCTTKEPTAVVVIKYFATSKNTLPSAFLRSQFTQNDYITRRKESIKPTMPPNVLYRADKVVK